MNKITKFIKLINCKINESKKIKGIILVIVIILLWFYVAFSFTG